MREKIRLIGNQLPRQELNRMPDKFEERNPYIEQTLAVSMLCETEAMVTQVMTSWSCNTDGVPQVARFGAEGGEAHTTVMLTEDGTATIRYLAKVNFAKPNWPVIEIGGERVVSANDHQVVLRPGEWLHRQTIHLLASESETLSQDHLIVNVSYCGVKQGRLLTESVRVTPTNPAKMTYLVDPSLKTVSASLLAVGVVNGRLLRSEEIQINPTEEAIYLLAGEDGIHLADKDCN